MIKRYLVSGLFAISLSMNIHANEENLISQTAKLGAKDLTAEARIKLYKNVSLVVVLTKSSGDPEQDEKILKSIRAADFKIFQDEK